MWIRSQDKEVLTNCEDIQYVGGNTNGEHFIAQGSGKRSIALGEYKTKERAIEVLDIIQNKIINGSSKDVIIDGIRYKKDYVFNMPKE